MTTHDIIVTNMINLFYFTWLIYFTCILIYSTIDPNNQTAYLVNQTTGKMPESCLIRENA